jgi:hypothetical protein
VEHKSTSVGGCTEQPSWIAVSDRVDELPQEGKNNSKPDKHGANPRDRAQLQISIKALGPWRDLFSRRSALDLRNYMLIPHMERGRAHHAHEHGKPSPNNQAGDQKPLPSGGNGPPPGGNNEGGYNQRNSAPLAMNAHRQLGPSPMYGSQSDLQQDYSEQGNIPTDL